MRKSMMVKLIGATFAAAVAASTATTWAQDSDEYIGGYGPYGMGPGMMGGGGAGCGGGSGMMGGGYGYGSGMMGSNGGFGMGPGMMGGGGDGMGPGMMGGFGALSRLDLTDEQEAKINKILDDERRQHWTVQGKVLDEQSKLRDLYAQETPDPKKVGAVYGQMAKLRQQMLEVHIQARNQIQTVLTKEQRDQLRRWNRGGWGPRGPGGGPGPVGPGAGPGPTR